VGALAIGRLVAVGLAFQVGAGADSTGRLALDASEARLAPIREALGSHAADAVTLAREVVVEADSKGDATLAAEAQELLADGLFLLRRYADARDAYEALARRAEDKGRLGASAQNGLGRVLAHLGEYEQASEHLTMAQSLAEACGDARELAKASSFLGILFYILEDMDRADRLLEEALSQARAQGLDAERADILEHKGIVRYRCRDYAAALADFEESLKLRGESNQYALAGTLGNIGLVHMSTGDFPQAEALFARSLAISRRLGDDLVTAANVNRLGLVAQRQGRLEEAAARFEESLKLFRSLGDRRGEAGNLRHLAEVAKQRSQGTRALADLEEFVRINDALTGDEVRRRVAESLVRHQSERQARRIELLEKDRTIQELRQRREALWRNALIAGLALLTALVVVLFNRYRLKTRAHRDLQQAMDQIRTLRGLLPICSSCKKIRNDGGYWIEVESFVRDHSDAEFTHGICPGCAERLYPEMRTAGAGARSGASEKNERAEGV
jgi:tetratricopeptide (TPR) repeat protein